jgi:hypothetical protein
MSQYNPLFLDTRQAAAAVSPNRFVKIASGGKAQHATAGTDVIHGVSDIDVAAATDDYIAVVTEGTAIVEASGAISEGAYVTATTDGKAVATTTAGHTVRGYALQAAGADGDKIEVKLTYFHHKA